MAWIVNSHFTHLSEQDHYGQSGCTAAAGNSAAAAVDVTDNGSDGETALIAARKI